MDDSMAAAGLLYRARQLQERAVAAAPKDWLVQVAWAVWVMVFIPPFDFVQGDLWGPVVVGSSVIGTVVCYRYYAERYGRVHPLAGKQWRVWLVWSPWYAAWIVFANVFRGRIAFAATLAAAASAGPLLGYALYNRRRAAQR